MLPFTPPPGQPPNSPPSVVSNNGQPIAAVWSFWDGTDSELAFAEWTGAAWSAPVTLTSNDSEDLEPRLALDSAGQPILTWWQATAVPAVFALRRDASGAWGQPLRISTDSESAMWPSIVVDESGETMIAYESNRGTISGIVIARPQPRTDRIPRCTDQIFAREFLVETPPLQTAAPILEAVEGRIWISWLAGAGRIGWCEWSGRAWGVPAYAAHSR